MNDVQLMIKECEDRGFARPKWNTHARSTTVTFPGVTVTAKTDDAVNDAVNDAVKRGVLDAVSDAVNDAVNDALTDAVNTIVQLKEGASIKDIMSGTGKSNATVKRYLQILKEINIIEFKGAPKTGRYYLTAQTKSKLKR